MTSSPPRTAPASCTWPRLRRRRQGDGRCRRHRRRHARSTRRAASTPRCRTTRASTSSTPIRRSSAISRTAVGSGGSQRRRAVAARDLRALVPALLAVPKPVDLPGGFVVVRQGDRVPRPHGGAQPTDHLVPRARQGRPVRQVAVECAGLVDLPKPLLGQPNSGVDVRRSGLPSRRRVRQPRRARARLRGAARQSASALHRRTDPAQSGRSDRQVDHAAHRGRVRRLVRLRFDAVCAGALSVRERRVVRIALSRPTSSSSTSARPAAGST